MKQDAIHIAAMLYEDGCHDPSIQAHVQAGANWAYAHGCVDPDTAELAGYKRGVEEISRPQEMTDEQIMAVLNAVGYEERCWIDVVRADIVRRYGDPN